ncbi:MAG: Methionine adenosyltransferase, partial [Candidatus Daviesbacteria bacterium GW2011_GWA1_38_7]
DGNPVEITDIVIAQHHSEEVSTEELRKEIKEYVIIPVCKDLMNDNTKIHINATGRFVIGGPEADTGLTGRKIIMDTYGGAGRHGGGAFSGKELASSIIFCEVGKTAYYITSGVRDKYHSSNGTTLLLYSYIEQLLEKGEIEILDLFGANTKKVAYFKSFFDPQFLLYFTATYKYVI